MLKEFKTFILRGNVVDMAIGIIIGAGFGKIVTSLVNDVIMPPIGKLMGKVDFSNLFINLSDRSMATLEEAKQAGVPVIKYGFFLNQIIDFLIVAFTVFCLVKTINKLKVQPDSKAEDPKTKDCSFCLSSIPLKATRCPHCTSALEPTAG